MNTLPLLVGCGAGFSGDRTDGASAIVDTFIQEQAPAVLIFETLAERTLAIAQLARRDNPAAGFEPLLDELLRPILARCLTHGIRIVSNFGAANPAGAAATIAKLAQELGLRPPRMAVVEGDDLSAPHWHAPLAEALAPQPLPQKIVSANAYIGAQAIADALTAGADIVVCGRVADPSLTVGPAMWHFGWQYDQWDLIAGATMAGHLLECGTQVTGGYFADPGFKDIPDLQTIGYPIAEIHADASCVIRKPAHTGGSIDAHVVLEQLLYEVHDPSAYLTPDVTVDLSQAEVVVIAQNQVRLSGVRGLPRPTHLKVNVCHEIGWLAEGEISYAGARAEARARLAASILRHRLSDIQPLRIDFIGVQSILADDLGHWQQHQQHTTGRQGMDQAMSQPGSQAVDVRLRAAANVTDRKQGERLGREVVALHTTGPAGAGGGRASMRVRLATTSCLVPRDQVPSHYRLYQSDTHP